MAAMSLARRFMVMVACIWSVSLFIECAFADRPLGSVTNFVFTAAAALGFSVLALAIGGTVLVAGRDQPDGRLKAAVITGVAIQTVAAIGMIYAH